MGRILVVEDDPRIGSAVHAAFHACGYAVTWTMTGPAAIEASTTTPVEVMVLDLGLPDIDGPQVCRAVRRSCPDTVIIMVAARDEDLDVITGPKTGADDYVTKPFDTSVLLARVAAHLRRRLAAAPDEEILLCGDLVPDLRARRCALAGRQVPLRLKRYDLLARLARDAGQTVTRELLMADVWDANWAGSTKYDRLPPIRPTE